MRLLLGDDEELSPLANEAERALAAELGAEGLSAIDAAILRHARGRWLKVARVIADALKDGGFSAVEEATVELHVRRVIGLVESGLLEGAGNLRKPRRSEVRAAKSAKG